MNTYCLQKGCRRALAVLTAGVLAVGTQTASVAMASEEDQTYRMRIQAAVPSGAMSFEMLERFGERLDGMSNGRINVRVMGAGAIVPSPQILDAVNDGVLEAGFAWPQFWSGKHPATALFSNTPIWPMAGLDSLTHLAWMYEGGGLELYHELLQEEIGVDVVSFFVTPSGWRPLGWFKEPIESMEDLQGLRYRSPPGLVGEIFSEAGVSTVFIGPEELVPAAERGVIDAAGWINPVEDYPLGFHDIFDYYYLASIHQFIDIGEIVINGEFWNSLPESYQEMIRTAAQATLLETYVQDIARNSEMIQRLEEEYGITVEATPADINVALLAAGDRVLARHSEDSEYFERVLDSQREFALKVAPWWGEVLRTYDGLAEDALIK